MSRLPRLTGKQVADLLRRKGFVEIAGKGSHRQFRRPDGTGRVTVPVHAGETLPPKTLRSILEQAGLTEQDLTT